MILNKEVNKFEDRKLDSKIVLTDIEPGMNPNTEELATVVLCRTGLLPRKKGATDKMHHVLVELYERAKQANRKKNPEMAVMTVEEMGSFAGITRQTMYDYLRRWVALSMVAKTSYISNGRVVIGYKLNGTTMEQAFEKAMLTIKNNLDATQRFIRELQRTIKNEKISEAQKINNLPNASEIENKSEALSED